MTSFLQRWIFTFVAYTIFAWVGEDWRQFRGEGGAGGANVALPSRFSASENLAWSASLPGKGPSSPIIVGDQVIVTCGSGPQQQWMHVCSFDQATGKMNWERKLWATGRPYSHELSGNAAPTPASDGKYIFAFFSSNDLLCFDLQGDLIWARGLTYDYPKAANDVGMASSPVVIDGVVIVQVENQGDSFAAGIDAETGENVWRISRPNKACWATPTVIPSQGQRPAMIALLSSSGLTLVEAKSGKMVWELDQRGSSVASPTFANGVLYAPLQGLSAIQFSETGKPGVIWNNTKLGMGNASPVVQGEFVYSRASNGVIACASAATGEELWRLRAGKENWSTPVASGGFLYCFDQDGTALVIKPSKDQGEIVWETSLDDVFLASPAIAHDAMYVRSHTKLHKITSR